MDLDMFEIAMEDNFLMFNILLIDHENPDISSRQLALGNDYSKSRSSAGNYWRIVGDLLANLNEENIF